MIIECCFSGLKYLLSSLTYHISSHIFHVENMTRLAENMTRLVLGRAYRGLTGGFLLLRNFSVTISVSPHVCFILV